MATQKQQENQNGQPFNPALSPEAIRAIGEAKTPEAATLALPKDIQEQVDGLRKELIAAAALAADSTTRKVVADLSKNASALVKANMSSPITRLAYRVEHETPVIAEVLTVLRGTGYVREGYNVYKNVVDLGSWLTGFFRPIG